MRKLEAARIIFEQTIKSSSSVKLAHNIPFMYLNISLLMYKLRLENNEDLLLKILKNKSKLLKDVFLEEYIITLVYYNRIGEALDKMKYLRHESLEIKKIKIFIKCMELKNNKEYTYKRNNTDEIKDENIKNNISNDKLDCSSEKFQDVIHHIIEFLKEDYDSEIYDLYYYLFYVYCKNCNHDIEYKKNNLSFLLDENILKKQPIHGLYKIRQIMTNNSLEKRLIFLDKNIYQKTTTSIIKKYNIENMYAEKVLERKYHKPLYDNIFRNKKFSVSGKTTKEKNYITIEHGNLNTAKPLDKISAKKIHLEEQIKNYRKYVKKKTESKKITRNNFNEWHYNKLAIERKLEFEIVKPNKNKIIYKTQRRGKYRFLTHPINNFEVIEINLEDEF